MSDHSEKAKLRCTTVGLVAGKIQHDLGNPLSVIRLSLKDGGRDLELLEAARQAADRVKALVDEMARIANLVQVKLQEVEAAELIRGIFDGVTAHYAGSRVEVAIDAEVKVLADPSVLAKVLSGCIGAASNAGALGSPVELSARAEVNRAREGRSDAESADGDRIVRLIFPKLASGIRLELIEPLLRDPGLSLAAALKLSARELELWRASYAIGAMGGSVCVEKSDEVVLSLLRG